MAFTARTETAASGSSLTTPFNFTINKATGVVDGDIMFMFLAIYIATPPTIDSVPAGWTQVATNTTTNSRWYLYYKIASGEGTSYQWSLTASCRYYALNVAYSSGDFNVASISDITAISNTLYATAGTTVRAASMSVPAANSPLVYFAAVYNTTVRTFTKPTAPTSDWVEDADQGGTTPDLSVTNGSMIWTGSGATGNMDVVCSITITTYKHAFAIALKPATAPITGGVAETGTLADTPGAVFTGVVSEAESGTGSDTPSAIFTGLASEAESGTGADTPSAVSQLLSAQVDSGAAVDTQAGGLLSTSAIAETTTATDSESSVALISAALAEALTAADSESSSFIGLAAIAEAGSAADTQSNTAILNSIISEASSAVDAQSSLAIILAEINEAVSAGELQGVTAIYLAGITESGTGTDTPYSLIIAVVGINESGTGIDTVDFISGSIIPAEIAEAASSTDINSALATLLASLQESGSLQDIVDGQVGVQIITATINESLRAFDMCISDLLIYSIIRVHSDMNIGPLYLQSKMILN